MRDSRGPAAGSTTAQGAAPDHPELSVRFVELASDLRAAVRHEMRGFIGALSLQLEIARRARGRGDDQRIGNALSSLSEDLEALSVWNEMGERWLIGPQTSIEALGMTSSGQLATDLIALLRVIGRRRRVTVEVEPLELPDEQLAVEPVARVSSLCFCVELLNQLSADSSERARVLTLRPASSEEAAGGLALSWSGPDSESLQQWLALQKTALPSISLDTDTDAVLLRWTLRRPE